MARTFEQINRPEDVLIKNIDDREKSDLQARMEGLLEVAGKQFDELKNQGSNKLWQMKNSGIISYVREARELLEQYKSSQIIQIELEKGYLKTEKDDARLLAFCRLVEISKTEEH